MFKRLGSGITFPRRTLIIFSLLSLIAASLSLAFVAQAEGATVQITSPTDGQSVGSGTVTVSGTVDRSGGRLAAEAGGPYEGEVDSAISLEGSGRGGTPPLSFIWTVQSGPDGASGLFGDATSAVTTFTADTAGSYALQLTTTDSSGAQASDTGALTVFPPPVATLYLTDVQTAQGTTEDCGPTPTYATKAEAPTDETSKKAYLGRAFGAFTCSVDFAHETPSPIQLNEAVRFNGWFGCDLPSAAPVDPATNALGVPINIDVVLTIDGVEVPGSRTGWSNGEFVCDGSNVLEIDVAIPTGGVTVPAGATLALQILPWWVSPTGANDPVENIHLLVDSTTHPSQLELEPGTGAESSEGSTLSGAGIEPEPLMLPVGDARPTNSYSIEEAVALVRQDSPDGPILPHHTNANGIGPGSAMLINDSQLCTAAWLFQDTDDGAYYLSTAGHCLITATSSGPIDGSSPVAANRVDICFKDCLVNWAVGLDEFLGIRGDYVTFEQQGSYDPVAFAQAQGIGADFGLIRIPASAHELLRPWMPQWGGATGIYSETLGFEDTAVHFGHGNYCCPGVGAALTRSPVDQGRVGQFHPNLLFSGTGHFEASAGWASGGDSGSAVGRADAAARLESKGVIGDTAVGVLTHGLVIGHSGFYGTLLQRGLTMSSNFVNNLDLVTENAVIGEAQSIEHVDLYANGELVAGDIAVGPTNDSDPADSWSAEVDFAAYEGQTVELEARWIDRDESVIDTHTITVSVKEPGAVSITSPTSGQKVEPPFTFEGAFDTGEAGSSGDSADAQILRGTSDEPYEIVSIPAAVRAFQESGPPTGPEAPRAHDGIGPGSAIRMGGFICSAAYLFEDPSTGTYYLSTAGHCLVNDAEDPTPYTGEANPDKVVSAIDICVMNCVMNAPAIGVFVRVAASGDYHPVTFAQSADVGADFALIEIPRELNSALRPWMPQWGGPTGVQTEDVGLESTAVHYGHGAYCCPGLGAVATRAPHDQGRIAQFNFSDADSFEAIIGWASGGDSGSGVGKADPFALESMGAIGDTAVGVLTHGLITGGGFFGTRVTKGVSMVQETLPGLQPALVLQNAVIRSSAPTVELGAIIEQPADGAEIDPGFTPMVTVSGSGTFPAEAGTAPAGTSTYFLHRDGCGATGAQPNRLWMDTTQGAVDSGSGCGTLTDPAGFLTSALWDSGSTVYTFPATPKPSGELLLGDGVIADIFYSGARGNVALPERGTVVTDFEGVLFYGGGNVVARGRATAINATHIPLPLTVENPIVPAGADLTFALIIHGSADIAFTKYGGEFGSRLTLPLVETPARSVQVSVDDPNFGAASLLDVSGTGSWSASWDAASAGVGQHTIYARAIQGESVSPATSVTVNVEESVGPSASFSWTADKRTASFTDQSAERGASIVGWSWDFGDGNTSTEQNPVHSYDDYGTFTVALTVTDSDGNSDTTQQEVTLTAAAPWLVEVQLTGPDGRIFGWTEVAAPAEGESGNWSLDWSPETAKSGAYKVEARLLRNGEVLATDAVDFEVIGGKTIRANLVGYSCDSTKWQFIINKIDGGPSAAPTRIHVTWDNGAEEDVPLGNASGKTARYVTTSNLDAKVTEATAFIYEQWKGKFNLGQGPCN